MSLIAATATKPSLVDVIFIVATLTFLALCFSIIAGMALHMWDDEHSDQENFSLTRYIIAAVIAFVALMTFIIVGAIIFHHAAWVDYRNGLE